MSFRINIASKIKDARAEIYKKNFNGLNAGRITNVELVNSYIIDAELSQGRMARGLRLLTNSLIEAGRLDLKSRKPFDLVIELGYLPGVTDNVGNTARETLQDGVPYDFKKGESVYSSLVFFITGKVTKDGRKKIVDSLYNPLIQKVTILPASRFKKHGLPATPPKVKLQSGAKALKVNLEISDEQLGDLGKLGILDENNIRRGPLALDIDALKIIRDYFIRQNRRPTDVEIETLAQTWSEHCKHTIFASPLDEVQGGIFKRYIKGATEKIIQNRKDDFCVSVFKDNSGAVAFDKDYLITHKVETHNSPSALDPFGGAVTGIVGVNRDALGFGLAAKPIANFYGFCLADPKDRTELYRFDLALKRGPGRALRLSGKMLPAERILRGVVAGINSGGNQSGIPTPLGFAYFDKGYRGKPLVFAGTVGLIPRKIKGRLSHEKKARPGDYIVMIGGRVGKDGIHGATFSSEILNSSSPAAAVQIGDPITQKKFSDVIIREARGQGLYNSITDNGAGGLSSSVGEMARESGGCLVYLDKVPVKYPGLQPWEIWISESQERMTLAVPKNKWARLSKVMKSRGVEATVIGEFTDSGKCLVRYGKLTVMDMDLEFMHEGLVFKHLYSQQPQKSYVKSAGQQISRSANQPVSKSAGQLIIELLGRLNICSFEFISQQYDHEVQGTSVTKPLQGKGRVNTETAVMRPVLSSQKGIVLSSALYPSYSELNPYNMAACSIDSAIRAAVAAGTDINRLALLDNFCWCSSDDPQRLWQLKQAAQACYDTAVAFSAPFISGKDSMFNDFKGFDGHGRPIKISIPPTLLISAVGIIPDISKTLTVDVKTPGAVIYILGQTNNELSGGEYEAMLVEEGLNSALGTSAVPSVNASRNLELYRSFFLAAQKNLIASAISVSRGGLAAALPKMCIAGMMGAEIYLDKIPCAANGGKSGSDSSQDENDKIKLFSESQGRILVTIAQKKQKQFESIITGSVYAKIGTVGGKNILIKGNNGKNIANLKLTDAEKSYKATLKNY